MTSPSTGRSPFDDLVAQVCHLELSGYEEPEEFREIVKLMEHNLEATLTALARYVPPNSRIRRASQMVKLRAVRLLEHCREIAQCSDDSEKWRESVNVIIATYEVFRIEAGHLYQLAVPKSGFAVLRAAL